MSPRTQRSLFWIFIAVVAFQIYVVREWLAGLLLMAAVCAGVAVVGAIALILNSAWRWLKINTLAAWEASRSAMAFARGNFARMGVAKSVLARTEIGYSNTPREEPVLWI